MVGVHNTSSDRAQAVDSWLPVLLCLVLVQDLLLVSRPAHVGREVIMAAVAESVAGKPSPQRRHWQTQTRAVSGRVQ